jgi:ElaB/YqjD/DUF883 family membrane-anchored ribosome-binding protein
MPRFQARYYDVRDDALPRRTEPIEAPDYGTALEWANAAMTEDEVRVELADPSAEPEDISSKLSGAAAQARVRYAEARERAETLYHEADQFVRARPYAALGIAALAGFLIGVHLHGRQVIYLKSAD